LLLVILSYFIEVIIRYFMLSNTRLFHLKLLYVILTLIILFYL
jgi:hypothetical protein